MKQPIIITILGAIIAGTFIVGQLGNVVQPNQLKKLEFQRADISLQEVRNASSVVTSTDDLGREYKSHVNTPVKYLFPIASSTEYVLEWQYHDIMTSLDAYHNCMNHDVATTTPTDEVELKQFCIRYYIIPVMKNERQTFEDSVNGRLNELIKQNNRSDITTQEIEQYIE